MQLSSVKKLLVPIFKEGREWQYITINGEVVKPKYYFSNSQFIIAIISVILAIYLEYGLSMNIIGYVLAAFSISVSLFMSLLVSIFDKFENTDFTTDKKSEKAINRLIQKKNFFKRFISITSYLVILSIIIIIITAITLIFNLSDYCVSYKNFTIKNIDWALTILSAILFSYRVLLNYLLLKYLLLTFFIAGSAHDYYMSELRSIEIRKQK